MTTIFATLVYTDPQYNKIVGLSIMRIFPLIISLNRFYHELILGPQGNDGRPGQPGRQGERGEPGRPGMYKQTGAFI